MVVLWGGKIPAPPSRHRGVDQVGRGHLFLRKHSGGELRFFAIRIEEQFEFRPDWYRGKEIGGLVLEYYLLLRSVLKSKPHLRRCRTRCRHCRIFFLTDPRNAGRKDMRGVGRKDLGCPFGCRKAHQRRESNRRSVAWNRTEKGRKRKQAHNQRRSNPPPLKEREPSPVPDPRVRPRCPHSLIEHVRIVVSLIEERLVSREEILWLLEKVLRQHRMARVRRIDQIINHLNQHPP